MIPELSIEYNPFICSWQLVNEAGDITSSFTPPADRVTVFPLAAEIAKNQPTLTARVWKAAQLVEARQVVTVANPGEWWGDQVAQVGSQTRGDKTHTIRRIKPERELSGPAVVEKWQFCCTCEDFHGPHAPRVKHQKFCKHILAFLLVKEQEKRAYTPPRPQGEERPPSWKSKRYTEMTEAEKSAFYAHQGMLDRKAAEERRTRWQTYNALENARKRSSLVMTQAELEHHVDYHW